MPATASPPLSASSHATRTRGMDGPAQPARVQSRERLDPTDCDLLATYVDGEGRPRQVLRRPGPAGSALVIDRDAITLADIRLVAHLAADEPLRNAEVVCEQYVRDRPAAARPRLVTVEDLRVAPPLELDGIAAEQDRPLGAEAQAELVGPAGERFRMRPCPSRAAIPELRWCVQPADAPAAAPAEPVHLRDVVGSLQSYEPARTMTALALREHRDDPALSVNALRRELERLASSPTVLNRALRERVVAAIEAGRLSMSDIAYRCGRTKRVERGIVSGETTWLARRLGLVAEGGGLAPTPWVHCDVLALVAREGIGVSPHEVELA